MKTLSFLSVVFFFLLINCEKEDGFKFGESETNFVVDSVYKTNCEGLLYVELDANWNNFSLSVYADEIPEPENEIAYIRWHGSITQPLEKNTYWKISYNEANADGYVRRLVIRWTPIE
jgi:hypothetical protein